MADEQTATGSTDDTTDDTVGEQPAGEHAAAEGAPLHPLIDLSRDPTPGKPDHAAPAED